MSDDGSQPEEKLEPKWTLTSLTTSTREDRVSALAIIETVIAAIIGGILLKLGLNWILFSSLLLAPLVSLRSPESIVVGVRKLDKYWGAGPRIGNLALIVFSLTVIALALSAYWLKGAAILSMVSSPSSPAFAILLGSAPALIPVLFATIWQNPSASVSRSVAILSAAFTFFVMCLLFALGLKASAVVELLLGSLFLSFALLSINLAPLPLRTVVFGPTLVLMAVPVITGTLTRILWIRFSSTLLYIKCGVRNFLSNWTSLILRTDILVEPEIIPGLPLNHDLRIKNWRKRTKLGNNYLVRSVAYVFLLTYIPSILYRLGLKSSVLFLLPLIWVAMKPKALAAKSEGGQSWDQSVGRSPMDVIVFLSSAISFAIFAYRLWDYRAYSGASMWAEQAGVPIFWPMILTGLSLEKTTIWHWLSGTAAALSLIVVVWSWQISYVHKIANRSPGAWQIWILSKLNTIKNAVALSMLLVGLFVVVLYYYEQCLLPTTINSVLSIVIQSDCSPSALKTEISG